ncbi:hypothetical protein E2C01_050394 [Portunus trituberculatus]|uniref:Uncharacterized protein n=1 Tax=Portunus trituberculatus TaxID=210409 RepID=A0A5B7GGD4_PORTR|nr:hypothetical protein [Portunus trituberculatus]
MLVVVVVVVVLCDSGKGRTTFSTSGVLSSPDHDKEPLTHSRGHFQLLGYSVWETCT